MKLPVISGIELVKRLHKFSFLVLRQRGSHIRMERIANDKIIKLTIPLHDELKKGTLHRILKDAEITLEEFEKYK